MDRTQERVIALQKMVSIARKAFKEIDRRGENAGSIALQALEDMEQVEIEKGLAR